MQDELADSIKKLKSLMRGLFSKRDQKTNPFITRLKGVFRFEGQLEKGVYSLYLSEHGFYFENLGVETSVETVEKGGLQLCLPRYTDFDGELLCFYIYGQNLSGPAITDWFNRNLLPVALRLSKQVELRPAVTREELSDKQLRDIDVERRDWGLDGAVFFDGYFFRNMLGENVGPHPSNLR